VIKSFCTENLNNSYLHQISLVVVALRYEYVIFYAMSCCLIKHYMLSVETIYAYHQKGCF